MPDRPREMFRNGRPVVSELGASCSYYHRVDPALASLVQPDGRIDPIHMSSYECVDLSSNCSRFSEAWYVLYPRADFGGFAIFKFRGQDLPKTIAREVAGAAPYDLKTEHDPEDDNYGHCETRVYREGLRMRKNQVKREGKNKLRLIFSRALVLELKAGTAFPLPNCDAPTTDSI
jgi:hypothetical protein